MKKQMILGAALGNNIGPHPAAWRLPDIDPTAYTSIEATVKQARAAERGGLQLVFLPDRLFMHGDPADAPPIFNIDPMITLAALATATERIGLVGTASTTFTEPYLLARQLKALDITSHGRAGWNAVPSYEPDAFASFGKPMPPRESKYERLHETLQIVQSLWGSWEYEAGAPDQSGAFANSARIRPINMQGAHVGSRGPLPIPPSEQGQPIVLMPASSGYGLHAAGMYANVVLGMPRTIKDAMAQRDTVRQAAALAGRGPDEIKYIAFLGVVTGRTRREALDKRRALDDLTDLRGSLSQLRAFLGLNQEITDPDLPFTADQLASLHAPAQGGEMSARLVGLAREGYSPRDLLAHAVLDPTLTVVGTENDAADFMQEWFESGAVDGFMLNFDELQFAIDEFVDHVVPELRQRDLFPEAYQGATLRENLGLPAQYGLDPRLAESQDRNQPNGR